MYRLYIDESGKNRLSGIQSFAPHFSVGGVMVHAYGSTGDPDFIRRRGDQIRFKYWGHKATTVFRGNDIRRGSGDYSIFQSNQTLKQEFESDILQYIKSSGFRLIWVGVNKTNWILNNPPIAHAITNGFKLLPHEKNLTQMLFEELLEAFIYYLIKKNDHGQIIVEAADYQQDADLLAVYNRLMFNGLPKNGWSNIDVRERLTCISFVTKQNKDPETQLADMAAHFLTIAARDQDNVGYNGITAFDKALYTEFQTKGYQYKDLAGTRLNSIKKIC